MSYVKYLCAGLVALSLLTGCGSKPEPAAPVAVNPIPVAGAPAGMPPGTPPGTVPGGAPMAPGGAPGMVPASAPVAPGGR